jgi:hypothetical protein
MSVTSFPELHLVEMWAIFSASEPHPLEVRSIWPAGIKPAKPTLSRVFDPAAYQDFLAFCIAVEAYVAAQNMLGYNMYATLNPIRHDLGRDQSASDRDVLCRRRLLVDIDRDHGKEHPASDAEIQAARQLADSIKQYLDDCGWPTPVRVMSGNGHQLIYRLDDLPNTDETTTAIREILRNLKATFSANGLCVDTTVSNASRVTKLPGTLARRGTEIENHPYRVARIYE